MIGATTLPPLPTGWSVHRAEVVSGPAENQKPQFFGEWIVYWHTTAECSNINGIVKVSRRRFNSNVDPSVTIEAFKYEIIKRGEAKIFFVANKEWDKKPNSAFAQFFLAEGKLAMTGSTLKVNLCLKNEKYIQVELHNDGDVVSYILP